MAWTVEFQEQALDDLRRLDHEPRRRILKYFRERLEGTENPRQFGKPLSRGTLLSNYLLTHSSPVLPFPHATLSHT